MSRVVKNNKIMDLLDILKNIFDQLETGKEMNDFISPYKKDGTDSLATMILDQFGIPQDTYLKEGKSGYSRDDCICALSEFALGKISKKALIEIFEKEQILTK